MPQTVYVVFIQPADDGYINSIHSSLELAREEAARAGVGWIKSQEYDDHWRERDAPYATLMYIEEWPVDEVPD